MQGDIIQTNTTRAQSGYGAALLVKLPEDTLYSLYLPLETAPSVYGSVESFDIDILTDPTKGKVEGKDELDSKDIEFLLHRDNVRRAKSLAGQVLDWLVVYQDGTGYTFVASTKVRSNDAEADVLKGTITFTPMSASELMDDVRDLIRPTVQFANTIPARLTFSASETEKTVIVKTDPTSATITAESNSSSFTATITDGKLKITTGTSITDGATGIVTIKAADSEKKYAPWETTIAVEYHA